MKPLFLLTCLTLLTACCDMEPKKNVQAANHNSQPAKPTEGCTDNCCAAESEPVLACKLTTPELQKRKATVLASLRKQVKSKKELPEGYTFTFTGSDEMLDELSMFIKTERMCCDFFTFGLSVKGDQSAIVLTITGPDGAKEFITSELEL